MNKIIGLYNLEPKIYNSALMQISQYHKQKGDIVYHYHPLFHEKYDKIYASSLFDFTSKKYVTKDMICGGTGFDIKSKLPKEIENCDLDYSFQPDCDFSMIWFSRGCFRNCPFCVVNEKEGNIKPVEPKNLNPNGKYIKIMDNNFFGTRYFVKDKERERERVMNYLHEINQPVDIQGFDIRLFDEEQGEDLQSLKHKFTVKFAWDNPKDNLDNKIEEVLNYLKPHQLECYILIGFWSSPEEDYKRVNHIWNKYRIKPYVMPYNKYNIYENNFSRWVNNFFFKSQDWHDFNYKRRWTDELDKKYCSFPRWESL